VPASQMLNTESNNTTSNIANVDFEKLPNNLFFLMFYYNVHLSEKP